MKTVMLSASLVGLFALSGCGPSQCEFDRAVTGWSDANDTLKREIRVSKETANQCYNAGYTVAAGQRDFTAPKDLAEVESLRLQAHRTCSFNGEGK